MCGIIVSEKPLTKLEVVTSMNRIIKRGPDQQMAKQIDELVFIFNRLAIMGLDESGMQPFENTNMIVVANGEIYNFRNLKKQFSTYDFQSQSDCEVLLPMYESFGLDMFSMLDAEFAVVFYDKKTKQIIAGRDPIGIRPLFYGYHKETKAIVFASEIKAIIDIVETVFPFPPGHYYINGEFISYSNLSDPNTYHPHELDETIEHIRMKLESGIIKRLDSDAPMGFLLSGGLDSSLVCSVAQSYIKEPIRTFSIGMDTDPIDLKYAKTVADYLGTNHTEVVMTKDEVLEAIDEVIYALETYDITTVRASIGMYILAKYIHKNTNIKVLLTGEVSDELFGYKYTDFAPSPEEFQKECKKRIDELYMYDVLRADRCLASNSLEARVPFGDIDFATYVMGINPVMKMNTYRTGKYLLRKAFEGSYLPKDILYRDKAAFSDAVGHSMVDTIKEYASSLYTDKEFLTKQSRYVHATPFTKEALYYREIFEKYYPNHDHVIIDYWMPNKTWQGCNVLDPSARVLSNYGNSGK